MKTKTPEQLFEQVDRLISIGAVDRFPWIMNTELRYMQNMAKLDHVPRDIHRTFTYAEYTA